MLMPDPETIGKWRTVIGGRRYADDVRQAAGMSQWVARMRAR
jgi:hypothetical protein